ncbi:MAG: DMT family transporter [Nitrososphaerales archaeon]
MSADTASADTASAETGRAPDAGATSASTEISEQRPRPRRLVLYLLGLGTVIFWGASFPLTKAALDYTGPTAIAFLRWTVSAIFLSGYLAVANRRDPSLSRSAVAAMLRAKWRTVAWVSFAGITLYYFLENVALRYTTATNAGVLSNLTPVFMVLIGALFLHERLAAIDWLALAGAFVGSALVSQGAGHLTLGGTGLGSDAMMSLAGLFGALFSIGGKQLSEKYPPAVVTTVLAATGALFLLPLALMEGLSFDLPAKGWGMIVLLGLGSGALANLCWLSLLAHTPASRAAMTLLLIPLISAGLSVAFLNEPITPLLVLGSALVLGGVIVVQRREL